MIRKLRMKLVCINMLIVVILLSIILGMLLSTTRTRLAADNIRMLRSLAATPITPFRPDDSSDDIRLPAFKITLSKEGEMLSCEGVSYDLSDENFLQEVIASAQANGKQSGILDAYHLRYLIRETTEEQIYVFSDISSEERAVRHLFANCLLFGFAGLALFLGVSILLAHWAVKPVEQAWEQQKQFVADASHELKTPLTVILTNAELLRTGGCEEQDQQFFLRSICTMGEQMRGLVEELLSLARIDDAGSAKMQNMLDWSKSIFDAVLPFEPVFYEKGLSIHTEIEDHIIVRGNEAQLKQVAAILLDNAQKYCAPNSETNVFLQKSGKNATLTVESSGEPIGKDELEKIFLRFYRLDKARSMNRSYGLGLAIAKQIVEGHRGKIWAESENGHNIFFVQLTTV